MNLLLRTLIGFAVALVCALILHAVAFRKHTDIYSLAYCAPQALVAPVFILNGLAYADNVYYMEREKSNVTSEEANSQGMILGFLYSAFITTGFWLPVKLLPKKRRAHKKLSAEEGTVCKISPEERKGSNNTKKAAYNEKFKGRVYPKPLAISMVTLALILVLFGIFGAWEEYGQGPPLWSQLFLPAIALAGWYKAVTHSNLQSFFSNNWWPHFILAGILVQPIAFLIARVTGGVGKYASYWDGFLFFGIFFIFPFAGVMFGSVPYFLLFGESDSPPSKQQE